MFCRSPVIITRSQFTGEYGDLQVLRVNVKAGIGHAASRGTTVKGWCCSSRECCGGRQQRILCRKNVACYKVSDSASETRRVLEKGPQRKRGGGGGFGGEYFFKHELIHCTVFMFMSQRRTTLQMVHPISNRCLQRTGQKLQTSVTTYSSNCTTNITLL
jgi:hypothetical protein